jgi:hypothetical protein
MTAREVSKEICTQPHHVEPIASTFGQRSPAATKEMEVKRALMSVDHGTLGRPLPICEGEALEPAQEELF